MSPPPACEIRRSAPGDVVLAAAAAALLEEALREGAIGLACRSEAELAAKLRDGLAVLAVSAEGGLAGLVLVAPWQDGRWVSTSALVVARPYRGQGLAGRLKEEALRLARERFPSAIPFGLTTSGTVMRLNARLGWIPVTYAEVCRDPAFWAGCAACPHHATLQRMKGEICFCTAMRHDTLGRSGRRGTPGRI